jgi:Tfp pilus assembly protein PilO
MTLTNFNKIGPEKKLWFITTILLLALCVIFSFIIRPTIKEIKDLRAEIIKEKIELEKNINQEKKKAKLGAKLNKIKPQLNKLEGVFINENRSLEFITTLEGIANKNSVEQKIDLKFARMEKNQSYKKIPLSITAKGQIKNLINYLVDLETLNYYLNIKTLQITQKQTPPHGPSSRSNSAKASGGANLILNADTYWR